MKITAVKPLIVNGGYVNWVFVKIVCQEVRMASQPHSRAQPGCTQRTCSPWIHT